MPSPGASALIDWVNLSNGSIGLFTIYLLYAISQPWDSGFHIFAWIYVSYIYIKFFHPAGMLPLLHLEFAIKATSNWLISMGWYKKDVTPVLTHWSYVFLALTHRFDVGQ